jgi:hypothetical protein
MRKIAQIFVAFSEKLNFTSPRDLCLMTLIARSDLTTTFVSVSSGQQNFHKSFSHKKNNTPLITKITLIIFGLFWSMKIKVLRNQGLFQTLKKIQVLQTLIFFHFSALKKSWVFIQPFCTLISDLTNQGLFKTLEKIRVSEPDFFPESKP